MGLELTDTKRVGSAGRHLGVVGGTVAGSGGEAEAVVAVGDAQGVHTQILRSIRGHPAHRARGDVICGLVAKHTALGHVRCAAGSGTSTPRAAS